MATIRCPRPELAQALIALDLPEGTLVWVTAPSIADGWEEVLAELTGVFEASQRAATAGAPIIYVVDGDDLLGRNGTGRAMVACGLLSAARSAAIENRKSKVSVNVIALESAIPPETVGQWVVSLARSGGPMGELVRLGGDHLGKALP